MAEELKPCPCCGGEAVFVELDDGGMVAVCASRGCVASGVARYACGDEPRPLIAETWNVRAAPAGHVVVPREVLKRSIDRWACCAMSQTPGAEEAWEELRALLSEQEGRKQ